MKLKTITITLAALLCSGIINAQKFVIKASFPGLVEGASVELESDAPGEKVVLATTKVVNGAFTLSGSVDKPLLARVKINDKANYDEGEYANDRSVQLMLENVPFTIEAAAFDSLPPSYDLENSPLLKEKNVVVKGGTEQNHFSQWRKELHDAELRAWYSEREWMNYAYDTPKESFDAAKEKTLKNALRRDEVAVRELNKAFIKAHPNYAISLILQQKFLNDVFAYTNAEYDDIIELLKNNVDVEGYKALKQNIDTLRRYTKGTAYTDFGVQTADGKTSVLSAFFVKDRYNIVDLWASWCGPCRAAIPGVKALYEKWKSRLNIISVSIDSDNADWKKAMAEEKMPWTQLVIVPSAFEILKKDYRLTGIPELLVIDGDGKILYGTGDPSDAHEFIDKLCAGE